MASRKSKSRWLLRDLPRSYVVIGVAGASVAIVAVSINWSNPPPSPAAAAIAQPTQAELEKRYRGTIIFPTDQDGICSKILLDNRTGHLTDGGYDRCEPDKPRKAGKARDDKARLRALGAAFRHGG
jgi:hypothetical protein